MTARSSSRRFFVVFFSLLFVLFVIFLSLWRLNLSDVGRENHEVSVSMSAGERLHSLFTPPILPGHPLYVLGMIVDRLDLTLAPPEKQFDLNLQYANTRLETAKLLISHGQLNLALSTITKAEKYVIAAAGSLKKLPEAEQASRREALLNTIALHKTQLTAMQSSFSDSGRSIIDGLIEQILILPTNR